MALALASLPGCLAYPNNYDNPNREEPLPGRRVSRWRVTDDSANVLAFGCYVTPPLTPPSVQAAVGQALVYELEVRYVDKSPQTETSDAYWCSGAHVVSENRVPWVENLDCFDFPERGVSVDSWTPIIIGRVKEPGIQRLMPGTGYRMQLHVVGEQGGLHFVPNGECDVNGHVAFVVHAP
jgi:hypothetical protein